MPSVNPVRNVPSIQAQIALYVYCMVPLNLYLWNTSFTFQHIIYKNLSCAKIPQNIFSKLHIIFQGSEIFVSSMARCSLLTLLLRQEVYLLKRISWGSMLSTLEVKRSLVVHLEQRRFHSVKKQSPKSNLEGKGLLSHTHRDSDTARHVDFETSF